MGSGLLLAVFVSLVKILNEEFKNDIFGEVSIFTIRGVKIIINC